MAPDDHSAATGLPKTATATPTLAVVPSEQRTPVVREDVAPQRFSSPTLQPHHQQFVICLLLHLGVPLLPLLFELLITQQVAVASFHIVCFTYVVSLGVSSRDLAQVVGSLVVAVVFAFAYALTMPGAHIGHHWIVDSRIPPAIAMGVMAFVHGWERHHRHVRQRKPFLETGGGGSE